MVRQRTGIMGKRCKATRNSKCNGVQLGYETGIDYCHFFSLPTEMQLQESDPEKSHSEY